MFREYLPRKAKKEPLFLRSDVNGDYSYGKRASKKPKLSVNTSDENDPSSVSADNDATQGLEFAPVLTTSHGSGIHYTSSDLFKF